MKVLKTAYDNYINMMETAEYPDCFDSHEQFRLWAEVETMAQTKPRMFPCRDCLPEYQARMAAEARCCNAKVGNLKRILDKGL
jgi:hypothetical protein